MARGGDKLYLSCPTSPMPSLPSTPNPDIVLSSQAQHEYILLPHFASSSPSAHKIPLQLPQPYLKFLPSLLYTVLQVTTILYFHLPPSSSVFWHLPPPPNKQVKQHTPSPMYAASAPPPPPKVHYTANLLYCTLPSVPWSFPPSTLGHQPRV